MTSEGLAAITQLRGSYSPMEFTIFEALLRKPVLTSNKLIRKVYPRKAIEPFNAQIVVNRAVTTLGKKLARYHEPYRIERRKIPKKRLIENHLVRNKTKLVK